MFLDTLTVHPKVQRRCQRRSKYTHILKRGIPWAFNLLAREYISVVYLLFEILLILALKWELQIFPKKYWWQGYSDVTAGCTLTFYQLSLFLFGMHFGGTATMWSFISEKDTFRTIVPKIWCNSLILCRLKGVAKIIDFRLRMSVKYVTDLLQVLCHVWHDNKDVLRTKEGHYVCFFLL